MSSQQTQNSNPPSADRRNAIGVAFRRPADGGLRLYAGWEFQVKQENTLSHFSYAPLIKCQITRQIRLTTLISVHI